MEQHPISPPPELVRQWLLEYYGSDLGELSPEELYLARCGAQWGYEQYETMLLGAMHAVVPQPYEPDDAPVDLKRQALVALHAVATGANDMREQRQDLETIRLALEQLSTNE